MNPYERTDVHRNEADAGFEINAYAVAFFPLGFLVGCGLVFSVGLGWPHLRPPLPPGTGYCGTQAMGVWILMLIGGPLAGVVLAVLAASIGRSLDSNSSTCDPRD